MSEKKKRLKAEPMVFYTNPNPAHLSNKTIEFEGKEYEYVVLERRSGESESAWHERNTEATLIQGLMNWRAEVLESSSRSYLAQVLYRLMTARDPVSGENVPPTLSKDKVHVYSEALCRWVPIHDPEIRVIIIHMDGTPIPQGPDKDPKRLNINHDKEILSKFKALCAQKIDLGYDREGLEWLAQAQKGIAFEDKYLRPKPIEEAVKDDPSLEEEAKKSPGKYVLTTEPVTHKHHLLRGQGYSYKMPEVVKIPSEYSDEDWDDTMAEVLDDLGAKYLKKYLYSIWPDDEDAPAKRRFLAQWLGIAMLGLANDQRFMRALILQGGQGTGKSTFIKVASSLFPKGTLSNVEPRNFGESDKLEALAGAKLNFVEELSKEPIRDDAKLRAIIDGSPQQIKIPYLKPFIIEPNCAHLYGTNRLPSIPGANPATLKRFVILELNKTFRGTDEQIMDIDKLIANNEHEALITWALAGAADAMDINGYRIPASCSKKLESWHRDGDSVGTWVEEELCGDDGKPLPPENLADSPHAKDIFKVYVDWCQENHHKGVAWKEFKIRLVDQGFKVSKSGALRAQVKLNSDGMDREAKLIANGGI